MTATTWNSETNKHMTRRKHGGHWHPLSRVAFEVLAAVAELGPETTGKDMQKESAKRARAAALTSWRGKYLPAPLLMLFAYNPIKASVYVHLHRLNEDGLVAYVERKGGYAHNPEVPRSYYSITALGRVALAYERARLLEESSGRDTLFRLMEA